MNIIAVITEADLGRTSHQETWVSFEDRTAARALLMDNDGRIALMHVTNKGYHKLPGGGVDEGETIEAALLRELKEEAGADRVEVIGKIGEVVEYREQWQRKGSHHCFLVKLAGVLSEPEQTDKELDHGYQLVWAEDIDHAIELVASGAPKEYGQDFEQVCELAVLQYVKRSKLL